LRFAVILPALVLLAAFSTVVRSAPAGVPEQEHALSGESLTAALKRGGYVIYFRHADTGPAYLEQGVDLKRCETQRNLNDNGREEAKLIGAHQKAKSRSVRCWRASLPLPKPRTRIRTPQARADAHRRQPFGQAAPRREQRSLP
jgi:hypothetical protein